GRRWRALLAKLSGFWALIPLFVVVGLLCMPFGHFTDGLPKRFATICAFVWTAYWLAVFTIGRTSLAWQNRAATHPWYIRSYDRLLRVPGFGWWLPRWWRRVMERWTRFAYSPAAAFERVPYETGGLVVLRALASLPGMYVVLRPILCVASTHLV